MESENATERRWQRIFAAGALGVGLLCWFFVPHRSGAEFKMHDDAGVDLSRALCSIGEISTNTGETVAVKDCPQRIESPFGDDQPWWMFRVDGAKEIFLIRQDRISTLRLASESSRKR